MSNSPFSIVRINYTFNPSQILQKSRFPLARIFTLLANYYRRVTFFNFRYFGDQHFLLQV